MPSDSSWEYLCLGWGCLGDQQALHPLDQHIHLLLELHWRKLELSSIYLTEASACKENSQNCSMLAEFHTCADFWKQVSVFSNQA